VWLAVHTPAPTVVRLWPQVVRFLVDSLEASTKPGPAMVWRLPREIDHPEYVVLRVPAGDPWLYVFGPAPNALRVTPRRIGFLREALGDLPATSPAHARVHTSPPMAAVPAAGA